jgi:hypothetical protein
VRCIRDAGQNHRSYRRKGRLAECAGPGIRQVSNVDCLDIDSNPRTLKHCDNQAVQQIEQNEEYNSIGDGRSDQGPDPVNRPAQP